MNQQEWDALATALKGCKNSYGTLHYNYDGGLSHIIDKYADANMDDALHIPKPIGIRDHYSIKPAEVDGAIANWIKAQQKKEEIALTTHYQATLQVEDEYSEKVEAAQFDEFVKQKKLIARGHYAMSNDHIRFPRASILRHDYAKALYELTLRAVEEFERVPTMFITFPNQAMDARVFGGFYGSPWSNRFNDRTLCVHLRERLPHFLVRVVRIAEWKDRLSLETYTHAGVLFLYRNCWGEIL